MEYIKMLLTKTLLYIIIIQQIECDWKSNFKHKMLDYKNKAQDMYGQLGKNKSKVWEFESSDPLSYPGNNPSKLEAISQQWLKYFECIDNEMKIITPYETLPYNSLISYQGATVYLLCNLCISPDDRDKITWWYSQNITKPMFGPMPETETMLLNNGTLTIYNVHNEDAGVYYCKIGDSIGGLITIEIIDDDEHYNVVKPSSANGPFSMKPLILSRNILMVSRWSSWSECSTCDHVGRRRRYGPCYIVLEESNDTEIEIEDIVTITDELLFLLQDGLPCRSQFMPKYILKERIIMERRNEIMIGLCKVPCESDKIFEVRNNNGDVIERVNNTAGVYSLRQPLPPQPPSPVRDIIFVPRSSEVHIQCPGTTLRDMPVTWKVGDLNVVPKDLDDSSLGRMYISARDQLVITSVKYTDTNIYSCWQAGVLAGSVKVEVWKGQGTHWSYYTTMLAMVLVTGVCARVAIHIMENKRKRINLI